MPWQTFKYIGDGEPVSSLFYRVRLSIISHKMQEEIFSPNRSGTGSDMQDTINSCQAQLLEFKAPKTSAKGPWGAGPANIMIRVKSSRGFNGVF
jgi:hypothetical protein